MIDEQHRFGVRQRAALEASATREHPPHMLHMTATPIPRTLALARYGDLDTSTLRELPRGRRPIDTRLVAGERGARARLRAAARASCDAGRQAFVVCPLVEEAEDAAGSGGAVGGALAARSQRGAPPSSRACAAGELRAIELALLHGGMRPREKQEAMAAFASGARDVLVATTVIEVGIDVPNATVMLIENAERFGISQLHQLRGRVGRGEHRVALLPASAAERRGSPRLRALAEHSDGFRLAEIDLELRNEGELVGTRQSGLGQLRASPRCPRTRQLLERARARAEAIVAADPELRAPEHALLGGRARRAARRAALEPIPA